MKESVKPVTHEKVAEEVLRRCEQAAQTDPGDASKGTVTITVNVKSVTMTGDQFARAAKAGGRHA